MQEFLPIKYCLAEDTIDQEDINALIDWLKTYPRLTKDKLTLQFEEKWNKWLGRRYSVFCNSGSSANELMYYAMILSGRMEKSRASKTIIVPSVGWVTTISPAIHFGLRPIMCEADPHTFGLDLNHLERLLKKHRPASVIMVQVLGVPHKIDELMKLKEEYGFILLEDACAAMGSSRGIRNVGTYGDMSSFSFYFGHQISTIEGGMISTDDKTFYDLLLMLRSHGWDKDLDEETRRSLRIKYKVDDFNAPFFFSLPGFNMRSTDLNAFLGIRQVDKMGWLIKRRWENHQLYKKLLGKSTLRFQVYSDDCIVSSIHFGALAKNKEERRRIVAALIKNGIETRMFSAGNLGRHAFWFERCGVFVAPMADRIHDTGFFLPNNPSLKIEDIEFISRVVVEAMI